MRVRDGPGLEDPRGGVGIVGHVGPFDRGTQRSSCGAVAARATESRPSSFDGVATRDTVRTREYDSRPTPNSARSFGSVVNAFATRTCSRAVDRAIPT